MYNLKKSFPLKITGLLNDYAQGQFGVPENWEISVLQHIIIPITNK